MIVDMLSGGDQPRRSLEGHNSYGSDASCKAETSMFERECVLDCHPGTVEVNCRHGGEIELVDATVHQYDGSLSEVS